MRLAAYDNEVTLWLEVLQSQPENSLAHQNVGAFLEKEGNDEAAIRQYREAIRLNPDGSPSPLPTRTIAEQNGRPR